MTTIYSNLRIKLSSSTVRGVMIVASATLLVKIVGFAKESIVGSSFGMTGLLDSFYILILIPAFLRSVFIGAFKAAFIPSFVNSKNRQQLFAQSVIIVLVISLILSVLGVIISPYINGYLSRDLSFEIKSLIQRHQALFYICIPLWSISSILTAIMDVKKKYFFSALSPLIPSLTIIVVLALLSVNIQSLYTGYILGAFFELVYLIWFSRIVFHFKWGKFWSYELRLLINQFVPKLTAGMLIGLNPLVDQFFSSSVGEGAISTLNYGNKLPAFVIGIIAVAITNVLLPHFSKMVRRENNKVLKELKSKLVVLFIVGTILSIFLVFFGEHLIRLLFERDKFSNKNSSAVYSVLLMYSIQIPFYVTNIALVRFLTAFNLNMFSVISSAVAVCLNFIGNYFLVKELGIKGVALSTSIVIFVSCWMKYHYVLHKLRR